MVWDSKKSLILSKICVLVFFIVLVYVLIAAPWLVRWIAYISYTVDQSSKTYFLLTIYTGGAVAAALLLNMYRLLHSLEKGFVFVEKNVRYLRLISWCCFTGCFISLLSSIYYVPWSLIALSAGFAGLIVRVVKNIVSQAIVLKEESDLTI